MQTSMICLCPPEPSDPLRNLSYLVGGHVQQPEPVAEVQHLRVSVVLSLGTVWYAAGCWLPEVECTDIPDS